MVRSKQDPLGVYLHDQEAVANRYIMKCFTVTMVVFSLTFILNLIGVFVIEQRLMLYAFFPSLLVYLIVFTVTRLVPLSRRFLKYFILSGLALFLTIIGIFLTYHVIIVPILLFLCATLYSSKRVMRYAYLLTITNTLLTVYGGYYFGLCDANMALLTTTPLQITAITHLGYYNTLPPWLYVSCYPQTYPSLFSTFLSMIFLKYSSVHSTGICETPSMHEAFYWVVVRH